LGVTSTSENGKAWVFWEGWIRLGELAEKELRAFAGFDEAGVQALGTEAEARVGVGG